MSLKHWQQMGGVNINVDTVIDKSIHKLINSRSAVLKVSFFQLSTFSPMDVMTVILSGQSITLKINLLCCVYIVLSACYF